jgi:type II secretory pathway pseudopilin PulG
MRFEMSKIVNRDWSGINRCHLDLSTRTKGFFLADAVMSLIILSLLAAVLMMAAGRQRHASLRLKDQRAATALAERALSRMQAGEAADNSEGTIRIKRLADGDVPAGRQWVQVTVTFQGRSASLVGLAPLKKEVDHE